MEYMNKIKDFKNNEKEIINKLKYYKDNKKINTIKLENEIKALLEHYNNKINDEVAIYKQPSSKENNIPEKEFQRRFKEMLEYQQSSEKLKKEYDGLVNSKYAYVRANIN
jgi:hypothetical protein